MDDRSEIRSLVLDLSDLEIALLLCRVAHGHCRVETTDDNIHDVAKELALICSSTFDLSYAIVDCSAETTLDEFCTEILPPHTRRRSQPSTTKAGAELRTVDVVIAKNFNHVDDIIQLQLLELMRTGKLTTQDWVLEAPADFVFLPLVVRNPRRRQPRLNRHLNDHLIISHFHDLDGDYVHLEDSNDYISDDQGSLSSVVRKSEPSKYRHPTVDQKFLDKLQQAYNQVIVGAELIRYQQDIIVFLRLSRAVAGGISSRSNILFTKVSKLLAALHGIDYLTPSIVALAARKVFRHRILVARPEEDRSLQYGSDIRAVSRVLAHADPDTILESVLKLEAPL